MTEEETKSPDSPPVEKTPEEVLASLQNEFEEMKNKYLRALADGENARKRLAKEKQEIISFSIENTICDFLPVIDNFENALRLAESASPDVKNWAIGFQMLLSQFRQVLQNYGINSFPSVGTTFDPNLHDAVEISETDETPEGTIVQEFTKGYRSAIRTIRPARVKVARPQPVPEPVSTNETKN